MDSWTYNFYSTHAFNYTVNQRAESCETPQQCTVVSATVDDELVFNVPCFFCYHLHSNKNIATYLSDYEQKFAVTLSCHFAHIPRCCANVIAGTFKSILEANVDRRCPGAVGATTFHRVEIYTEEQNEAVMESFDQEAAGPKMKPASADVVRELLRLKDIGVDEEGDQYENGWGASDYQCMICLDEILTRSSSFTMGCSHVFHEDCLLEWLGTSHVCPLCRYKLPTNV